MCGLISTARNSTSSGRGKPVENSYIESFNGRLRNEFLNVEVFFTLADLRDKLERGARITTRCGPTMSVSLPPNNNGMISSRSAHLPPSLGKFRSTLRCSSTSMAGPIR
jgi:hypothetical protein